MKNFLALLAAVLSVSFFTPTTLAQTNDQGCDISHLPAGCEDQVEFSDDCVETNYEDGYNWCSTEYQDWYAANYDDNGCYIGDLPDGCVGQVEFDEDCNETLYEGGYNWCSTEYQANYNDDGCYIGDLPEGCKDVVEFDEDCNEILMEGGYKSCSGEYNEDGCSLANIPEGCKDQAQFDEDCNEILPEDGYKSCSTETSDSEEEYEIPDEETDISDDEEVDDEQYYEAADEDTETEDEESTDYAMTDETVQASALGLDENPGLLPNSRFYFLKNLSRTLQSAITFDDEKQAALNQKFANEKALEVQALIDEGDAKTAVEHLESYQEELGKAKRVADKLKEENPEAAKRLAAKAAENQFIHQDILGTVERKAPAQFLNRIIEHREESLEQLADNLSDVGSDTQIASIVERITKTSDSPFKRLKHLEVLEGVEDKLPEKARQTLRFVQEKTIEKFGEEFSQLPPQRRESLADFVQAAGGDEVSFYDALGKVKGNLEDIKLNESIDKAQQAVMNRLENRIASADRIDPNLGRQLLDRATDRAIEAGEDSPILKRVQFTGLKRKLGDLTHSDPQIAGGPELDLPTDSTDQFRRDQAGRDVQLNRDEAALLLEFADSNEEALKRVGLSRNDANRLLDTYTEKALGVPSEAKPGDSPRPPKTDVLQLLRNQRDGNTEAVREFENKYFPDGDLKLLDESIDGNGVIETDEERQRPRPPRPEGDQEVLDFLRQREPEGGERDGIETHELRTGIQEPRDEESGQATGRREFDISKPRQDIEGAPSLGDQRPDGVRAPSADGAQRAIDANESQLGTQGDNNQRQLEDLQRQQRDQADRLRDLGDQLNRQHDQQKDTIDGLKDEGSQNRNDDPRFNQPFNPPKPSDRPTENQLRPAANEDKNLSNRLDHSDVDPNRLQRQVEPNKAPQPQFQQPPQNNQAPGGQPGSAPSGNQGDINQPGSIPQPGDDFGLSKPHYLQDGAAPGGLPDGPGPR